MRKSKVVSIVLFPIDSRGHPGFLACEARVGSRRLCYSRFIPLDILDFSLKVRVVLFLSYPRGHPGFLAREARIVLFLIEFLGHPGFLARCD